LFRVRTQPNDFYLWLHISRSPATDAKGTIGSDVWLESMTGSLAGPDLYDARPPFFDYPQFWMNQPGTYYWQVHRISYANGADGAVEGPVRSFTLAAPAAPPPAPVPPVPPATSPQPPRMSWLEAFPDLAQSPIPRWVAGSRRLRSFVTSRRALPPGVSRDRWLALADTTAGRWGLRSRRVASYGVDNGDYENQVGFGYDLRNRTLGSTITSQILRYRRVRVCGVRTCWYRRHVVRKRTVDRDIVLNYWKRWQEGPAYPTRREYDLQTVLIHEMGHLAGNGHRGSCVNSPMVEGGLPGDWWRSPGDYYWVGCGSSAGVTAQAATANQMTHRVIRAYVPANATRAEVHNRLKAAVAHSTNAAQRELAEAR
jgi:hypothetical protein